MAVGVLKWVALGVCVLLAVPASAAVIEGRVVAVADGDTVTVLDARKRQQKVRLTGIDAPEKRQPFGEASRQHLAGLVFGRAVEARCPKRDRYGRWLCKLRVDGRDANFAQLAAGMAWHYKAYGKDQGLFDFTGYALIELEARYRRRGLWADPRPQAPWAFRRARREAGSSGDEGARASGIAAEAFALQDCFDLPGLGDAQPAGVGEGQAEQAAGLVPVAGGGAGQEVDGEVGAGDQEFADVAEALKRRQLFLFADA